MPAYDDVPASETAPEKPVLSSTLGKTKNNYDGAWEQIVGGTTSPVFTPDFTGHDHDGVNSKIVDQGDFGNSVTDRVISSNTTESFTLNEFRDLTINAGITWTIDDGFAIILVNGDLVLDGDIKVIDNDQGGASGNLNAAGDSGLVRPWVSPANNIVPVGGAAALGGSGGASFQNNGGDGGGSGGSAGKSGILLSNANTIPDTSYFQFGHGWHLLNRPTTGSAGGSNVATTGGDGGNAGGAVIIMVGGTITSAGAGQVQVVGNAGTNASGSNDGGGGGGGAAGSIWIMARTSMADFTANVTGGAGGNGLGAGGNGGGGGAGGFIALFSPTITSVSTSTAGGGGGTGTSSNGTAGGVGNTVSSTENYIFRWY